MKQGEVIDVLIIGAGPTGTSLAIDLARRGLKIRIIDKSTKAFEGSRAKGIQPRTLEVLEDLGAIKSILAAGSLYPKLGIHLGPLTLPWKMMRNVAPTASVPYPNTWLIPQFSIDRALHARLDKLHHNVEFSSNLVELEPDPKMVMATISTPTGHETIAARYLVGADGGSSEVRKQMGVKFNGVTDEQDRILIVDAHVTGLSRDRWHLWPASVGFIGACPLPHSELFQWMIRPAPGEEAVRELSSLTQLIRSRTRDPRITLHSVQWQSVFRPNIRLAEDYRDGRVLLAGDAAHVHTPAGAQGLNTGIQDAYNLGWKLAQVLAGADDSLLDTYEAERRPIAARVLGLSTKKFEAIAKLDPSAIRRGKDEQQLSITYRGGPLAKSDERTKTLRVGDRAPDAELCSLYGDDVRLFQLFSGPHFTAIAYRPQAAEQLSRLDWPSRGAPLKRVIVDGSSFRTDHALIDTMGTFRKAYGVEEPTLVLVRPDGYLACIASSDMLTKMRSIAAQLTP